MYSRNISGFLGDGDIHGDSKVGVLVLVEFGGDTEMGLFVP